VTTPNKQSELSDLLTIKPAIGAVLVLQDAANERNSRQYFGYPSWLES